MQVSDLRNISHATVDLDPRLNVFVGRNAQGKTSLLEATGLVARGRSFRTDDVRALVRRGTTRLTAAADVCGTRTSALSVQVGADGRRLFVDEREVRPRDYQGRLEVVVYSTERLKVVRGPMRERRQFLDRAAGALWPAYRQVARDYERILAQRNAVLEAGGRGLEPWNERFVAVGAALRTRRARYVAQVRAHLTVRENPGGERYDVIVAGSTAAPAESEERRLLQEQLAQRERDEARVRHSLVGPHRDDVALTVNEEEVAVAGSSGQARSLLLALSLAMLDVFRAETGESAVALLDDLDSELDEERATAVCHEVCRHGQAMVTTAHPGWARRLAASGRLFDVEGGRVRAA